MRARLNFPARRDRRRKRVRWCSPSPLRQFEQVAKPPGVDGFCRRAREKAVAGRKRVPALQWARPAGEALIRNALRRRRRARNNRRFADDVTEERQTKA